MGSEQEGSRPAPLASMTMCATHLAHHIGEVSCRITGDIGRFFAFEIHAKFGSYRHCEVVQLMYECVDELSA